MGNSSQSIPVTRLGVFATPNNLLGTAAVAGFTQTPCVIGQTLGSDQVLQNQPIARGSGSNDQLGYDTVENITAVSDVKGGVSNYINNVDYTLDDTSSPNDSVKWLGTVIPAPTGLAAVVADVTPTSPRTGLTADNYFYQITAIRQIELSPTPTNGETTALAEIEVVVGGPNNAVELTWTSVKNAQGYNIYRFNATGGEVLIATVMGGASNSFLDDGYAAGVATPPVSNTAVNQPATGATYYVTYEAVLFNYFNPATYYSLNQVIADHGLGSDVVIAATLILGSTGLGQGASKVVVVATPDLTEASFLTALGNILDQDIQFVIPLVDNDAVAMDVIQHCVERSSSLGQHPREGIFGATRGTPLGDPNTIDSLVWKATRLVVEDVDSVPQGKRGQFISNSGITVNVFQADGQSNPVQLGGWQLAAAHAGLVCSLPDTATSGTFKTLQGIASLDYTFTDNERDFLQQNGLVTYVIDTSGQIKCYQDRTLDTFIVENQERSIVSADDQIFRDLLTYFENYIGRKITPNFLNALVTGTAQVLGIEQKNQILLSYNKSSIVVTQPFADKRIVVVTFSYSAMYPCNQLVFSRAYNV